MSWRETSRASTCGEGDWLAGTIPPEITLAGLPVQSNPRLSRKLAVSSYELLSIRLLQVFQYSFA
jgi:hypothetical protein